MIPHFTPRERKVMRFLSLGLNNEQIGNLVGNTEQSVQTLVPQLFDKTGMSTRLELAMWYWHHFPEELALKRTAEMLSASL